MSLKKVLCGAIALPLIFVGGALASSGSPQGLRAPAALERQAGLLPAEPAGEPVRVAQAADPRVNGLEEQLRDLNGKIEELNFQVLQMQDQIRKMQQDNEFRFQQLEGGGGNSGKSDAPPPKKQSSAAPPGEGVAAAAPVGSGAESAAPSQGTQARVSADGQVLGAPPRNFGTITFDANGNVVGGTANGGVVSAPLGADQGPPPAGPSGDIGATVASLPPGDSPDELYRNSYQFILSGEYKTAEAGFRKHISRFPKDPRAADAHFWLGEALLGQDRYRDAAEVFLKANREYPNAKKAPDMLLKLGISLAAMNQRDVACATYGEIGQRYPDITSALKQRVKQEERLAGC